MSLSQPKYRLNAEPRISANQLAEYTLASPTRRQAIIRNAKYAPTYLVIRYSSARKAIAKYLSDDARNMSILHNAEFEQIELSENAETEFQKNDAMLSAEAIKSFSKMQVPRVFNTLTFRENNNIMPKIPVKGVDISVSIDLVSRNESKRLVGGVMLQTSKAVSSKSWRDEHSSMVSSLIWMQAEQNFSKLGFVDRKICFAIDVFSGKPKQAPSSYKRRLKDIEASCAEIATMWASVSPPNDYDGPSS